MAAHHVTNRYVVAFSSGAGSYAAAARALKVAPPEQVTLVFTDVKGDNPSPHAGEDDDNYRFLLEAAADLYDVTLPSGWNDDSARRREVAAECLPGLVWLIEGRDIWQVFHDKRFLGNSRLANCSHILKQEPFRAWLDAERDPADTTVVVGIDWSEADRIEAISRAYAPYRTWAPLTEPPYLEKDTVLAVLRERGVEPPRLYRAGFPHANCGGFCVRSGMANMALLLREHPARYAYHEQKETELRDYLGKDVAILGDRVGTDKRVPITLQAFRERIEAQLTFDDMDWGGCGCFTAPVAPDDTTEAG